MSRTKKAEEIITNDYNNMRSSDTSTTKEKERTRPLRIDNSEFPMATNN